MLILNFNLKGIRMKNLTFTIDEACSLIGVGRTKLYEALDSGELPARKWGKRTLILKIDLENFLEKLEAYPTRGEVKNG